MLIELLLSFLLLLPFERFRLVKVYDKILLAPEDDLLLLLLRLPVKRRAMVMEEDEFEEDEEEEELDVVMVEVELDEVGEVELAR